MFEEHYENLKQKVCNNQLEIIIGLVPLAGSKGYKVAKVECHRLPFYGEKVAAEVSHIVKADPDALGKEVVDRLIDFAKTLDLKVSPKYVISKDPNLIPQEDERYGGNEWFNLFVDLGSTNSKWMIARCDKEGRNNEPISIERARETAMLCGEWGIRYDKALAYTYNSGDFVAWLASAAVSFVRHVQKERQSYAVNVYWAFPKMVAGIQESNNLDFGVVSEAVTRELKGYGLRGRFVLMPEAKSLKAMFGDRIAHIAIWNAKEETENRQEEESAKQHNKDEDRKASQRKGEIEAEKMRHAKELAEYRGKHSGFWGKISGLFTSPPKQKNIMPYVPSYVKVVKDRLHELKDFRNIGVVDKMPFDMLFLDAGGSTLDFYYIPAEGLRSSIFGSYRAGGRQVTEKLMKLLHTDDFQEVEDKKVEICRTENDSRLREATKGTYGRCLDDIAQKIKGHGECLCVVCTGLAMKNACLRKMVREKLSLADNQRILWSDDIARMADHANQMVKQYPDFEVFKSIVRRLQPNGQGSPAYDVVGGLYFACEREDR